MQKLVADDLHADDEFGWSVVISGSGEYIVSGSYGAHPANQGAAYVHYDNGGGWAQQQKLQPSGIGMNDFFAFDVAVDFDGTRLIAGSHQWDGVWNNEGAAFIFVRNGTTWTQEDELTVSGASANDLMGYSVDMDGAGDVAITSAHQDDPMATTDAGAAYIFRRSGSSWAESQMLTTTPPLPGDEFGVTVAIDTAGATLAIGAHHTDIGGSNTGSVYVFIDSMGTFVEQAVLYASDPVADDQFGATVDISNDGDTIVVGCESKTGVAGALQGAAYVFHRTAGVWTQVAKIEADDGQAGDMFGRGVTVNGDGSRVIVGAAQNTGGPNGAGVAYLFQRVAPTNYVQVAKLTANDAQSQARFGYSASLDDTGNNAVCGSPRAEHASTPRSGASYYFSFA